MFYGRETLEQRPQDSERHARRAARDIEESRSEEAGEEASVNWSGRLDRAGRKDETSSPRCSSV